MAQVEVGGRASVSIKSAAVGKAARHGSDGVGSVHLADHGVVEVRNVNVAAAVHGDTVRTIQERIGSAAHHAIAGVARKAAAGHHGQKAAGSNLEYAVLGAGGEVIVPQAIHGNSNRPIEVCVDSRHVVGTAADSGGHNALL